MTDAEIAILSLLAEGPQADTMLRKQIESRGLRRWTAIGTSSMYYVLDKLEKQGLIRKMIDGDGLAIYRNSAAGMGILQTAMVDLLATPHTFDRFFELGLANLTVLKTPQVRTALLSRQQDLQANIDRLERLIDEEMAGENTFSVIAVFSHRRHMMQAEAIWLQQFISEWELRTSPDPEPISEPTIIPRNRQVILPHDPDSIHKVGTKAGMDKTPRSIRTRPIKTGSLDPLLLPHDPDSDE